MAGMKVLLLGLAAMLLQADALIERLTVRDDTRLMFAVDTFGFDEGGKIDLKIKKVRRSSPPVPPRFSNSEIFFSHL